MAAKQKNKKNEKTYDSVFWSSANALKKYLPDLVDIIRDELIEKNKLLATANEQLASKDEQIASKDEQIARQEKELEEYRRRFGTLATV